MAIENVFDESGRVKLTDIGGLATLLINVSGTNLLQGTIVAASSGTSDLGIVPCSVQFDAIGSTYELIPPTKAGWVTTTGVGYLLLENGTSSVRGDWIRASTVAGRATPASSPAGLGALTVGEHFKEIGHCLETKAHGTNVVIKGMLHFN